MILSTLARTSSGQPVGLTTLARFKDEIGVTGTQDDVAYQRLIDVCSNEIANFIAPSEDEFGCVTLGRETFLQTLYDTAGARELILARTPIGEVTAVAENGLSISRQIDGEPNPAFPYVVKKASGLLWKMVGGHPTHFAGSTIAVTYSAGWILPGQSGRTLPEAIEDACLRFCRMKQDQVAEGDDLSGALSGVNIEGVGNFQFSPSTGSKGYGLPYEVRNLLERYRRPVFV